MPVTYDGEPDCVGGNSEAEKRLNYNLLPKKTTQMKMDYLINPYNEAKYVYKHMSFHDDDGRLEMDAAEASRDRWNKISKLVLAKNKKSFRGTLMVINSRLYVELGKQVRRSADKYLDFDDLQRISTDGAALRQRRSPERKNSKRELFVRNAKGRASIMTMLISDFRDAKDRADKTPKPQPAESQLEQQMRQLCKARLGDTPAKTSSRYTPRLAVCRPSTSGAKWAQSDLLVIPEARNDQDAFLNRVSARETGLPANRPLLQTTSHKPSKKQLLAMLLSGEHEVFRSKAVPTRTDPPAYYADIASCCIGRGRKPGKRSHHFVPRPNAGNGGCCRPGCACWLTLTPAHCLGRPAG